MKKEVPGEKFNRLVNHGPVLLVTTERKGKPNVMTMAWYSPLSKEPPLVGAIIARERYTHRLASDEGEMVLNLPPRRLVREVYYCGSASGRDTDKFSETGLHKEAAYVVRPPLIRECIGHIECEIIEMKDIGDHTLFIARPVLCLVEASLFDEVWNTADPSARGIHHLGGPFFISDGPAVEVDFHARVDWEEDRADG